VEHIEIVAIASVIPASDGFTPAMKRAYRQPFPNADANGKNVINAKQNICQINLAHTERGCVSVKGRMEKICRVHPHIHTWLQDFSV